MEDIKRLNEEYVKLRDKKHLKIGLNAEDCIYIDDREGNLEAAKKVGMNPILLNSRNVSYEGVSVDGFVGKPTYSKSNRTYQTLIINGRYVINLTVQTAVANAYGDFLMKRQ